ncbi:MAG: RNA polymerase sigma factor [Desulfurivibrio sp.]|nr:RNA polymerase sigma factor [Desulfurivibrio sp.]
MKREINQYSSPADQQPGSSEREQALVARVLAGERECFAELVASHQSPIYNLALRLSGGSSEQAADLCQEIFTRCWLKLPSYDPSRPFFTWLYTLALNVIRNHQAQNRRRPSPLAGEQPETAASNADPTVALQHQQRHEILLTALRHLPHDQREALLLRYLQEFSFADLAATLEISKSAAKMRVRRGLDNLRQIMARQKNCDL